MRLPTAVGGLAVYAPVGAEPRRVMSRTVPGGSMTSIRSPDLNVIVVGLKMAHASPCGSTFATSRTGIRRGRRLEVS
ncbi:MAG: hypothetical protein J4G16_11015 [Acidobacteria bacterium]|nr:hypothetical protein [Acidobacteriota bacterium]